MNKPWEEDNCAHLKAQYSVYSVPAAAALWCGVPESNVEQIVEEASQLSVSGFGRGVWKHSRVPCMEVRSRVLAEAIESGELPHGREDGQTLGENDYAAAERRAVLGRDLREWMVKNFPNEKPAFLFDDIEQSSHTAISADAFRALTAEKEKLDTRLKNAKEQSMQLRSRLEMTEDENRALKQMVDSQQVPGERAETTYHNIIAALLDVIAGNVAGVEQHQSVASEARLIELIDEQYTGYPGLSKSNLQRKFPEAKRALKQH